MKKKIKQLLFFFTLILLYAGSVMAQSPATWTARPNLAITTRCNGLYEYLPQGYADNTTTSYPLIICFHGAGENGNGSTQLSNLVGPNKGLPTIIQNGQFPNSFIVNGSTYRFIVIAPQFSQDMLGGEIDMILEWVKSNYRVDLSRIYITGFSQGGGSVIRLLGEVSTAVAGKIAAAVPMCTSVGYGSSTDPQVIRIANANVPLWFIHNGDDDNPFTPYSVSNNTKNNINAVVPQINPLAFISDPPNSSGHNCWDAGVSLTYRPTESGSRNIFEWMLQYSRSGCQAPTNPTATGITTTSATINWTFASNALSYAVDYQLSGAGTWISAGTALTTNTVQLSGLTAGSLYNYRIKSNCSAGTSSNFISNSFTTAGLCQAATNLASSSVTGTSATVSWTAAGGAASYTVEYKVSSATNWASAGNTTNTTIGLSGLTASTLYNFRVISNCAGSVTNTSAVASFTTSVPSSGCGTVNIALGRTVTASSTSNSVYNYIPARVVDGDINSRWESVPGVDPQWIAIDLGSSKNICKVDLKWEYSKGKDYLIQVSNDASTWTTVAAVTGNSAFDVTYSFNAPGRYVRMYGTARLIATNGYSLYEFAVFEGNSSTCPSVTGLSSGSITSTGAIISWAAAAGSTGYLVEYKTSSSSTWLVAGTVTGLSFALSNLTASTNYDCRVTTVCGSTNAIPSSVNFTTAAAPGCGTVNIALDKTVTASSTSNSVFNYIPARVVDGDINSRWESVPGVDPQWISIDLGSIKNICKVELIWEYSRAKDYQIQVSNDALTWNTVASLTGNSAYTTFHNLTNVTGRYVRMYGTARLFSTNGYSLYEFRVFETTGSPNNTIQRKIGLINNSETTGVSIYPNPTNGIFTITIPANRQKNQSTGIQVFDASNRLIKSQTFIGATTVPINIKSLTPGIYYVRVINGKEITTQKIIKN